MHITYVAAIGLIVTALAAWLATSKPLGRASRYVALILISYTVLWAGVGHALGYTNPWVIGVPLFLAAADLAALPWWIRYTEGEEQDRDGDGYPGP